MRASALIVVVVALAANMPAVAQESATATPANLRSELEQELSAYEGGDLPRVELLDRIGRHGPTARRWVEDVIRRGRPLELRKDLLRLLPTVDPGKGEAALASMASDDDRHLRTEAISALADVATAASVEPLLRLLDHDKPSVRAAAAVALGSLAQRDPFARVTLIERLHARVQQALQPQATDKGRAASALQALASVAGAEALTTISDCLDVPELRRTALGILVRADPATSHWGADGGSFVRRDDVAERLIEVVRRSDDPNDLGMALQAMGCWGDYGCIELLLELLAREEAQRHAPMAVQTLAQLTGKPFTTLEEWTDFWAAASPVWEEFDLLLEHVQSADPRVCEPALLKLSLIRDRRTVETVDGLLAGLVWMLPHTKGQALAACDTLASLKHASGAGALIRLLETPEAPQDVRKQAAWALGVIASKPGPIDAAHWRTVFPAARTGNEVIITPEGEADGGVETPREPAAPARLRIGSTEPGDEEQEVNGAGE